MTTARPLASGRALETETVVWTSSFLGFDEALVPADVLGESVRTGEAGGNSRPLYHSAPKDLSES
jgi:hypothetical protein